VPDYAGIFCQLSIISIILSFTFISVWHGIISTGKNNRFRIIDSSLLMLVFPLTLFGLHISPVGYKCSIILVNSVRVIYAMFALRKLTCFPIRALISQSLLKCFAIGVISVPLPFYITLSMSGWQGFLACASVFFVVFAPSAWFIGLNGSEREKVVKLVKNKLSRN